MSSRYLRYCGVFITAVLSTIFVASGVDDLLAVGSAASERASGHLVGATAGTGPLDSRRARPDAAAILTRNVFGPNTGSLSTGVPASPVLAPMPQPTPQLTLEPRCESEMRISAALYDERRPERSRVVLRGPKIGAGRPYVEGMTAGDYTVEQVHPRAVRLQGMTGPCWLGMFNHHSREKVAREQAASKPRKKARAASKAARKRKSASTDAPRSPFSDAELRAGVRRVDSTRFVLSDSLVNRAIERMSKIARANRFVAVQKRSRTLGVRIARLPRDGLLSRLGLERGDLLKTLNGYMLGDARDMVDAYAHLGGAHRLTLVVQRGRRTVRFDYEIQ